VARERVDMLGRSSKEEHMASYGRVDVALDTFPYHGTTTTCDALWMGLPVITLAGQSHVARVGVSLLTRVGLCDLVANTEREYIDHAVRLANSRERLGHLRKNLRQMVADSGLCDGLSFTRDIESTYDALWKNWCCTHAPSGSLPPSRQIYPPPAANAKLGGTRYRPRNPAR
jgi:predicted O-linked N-acetylglucosamine transferase (SPINDLY family)